MHFSCNLDADDDGCGILAGVYCRYDDSLDPAIEQRIQKQLSRGAFTEPTELLAYALDLIEAEEGWLLRNRSAIAAHIEESFAQSQRGETYSPEEARAMLAERRAARASQ